MEGHQNGGGGYGGMNPYGGHKEVKGAHEGHQNGGRRHPGVQDNCRLNQHVGGGSDWRSTLYSRIPVNVPDMDPRQFRMFTQEADLIPNSSLRTANFLKGGRRRKSRKSKKIKDLRFLEDQKD